MPSVALSKTGLLSLRGRYALGFTLLTLISVALLLALLHLESHQDLPLYLVDNYKHLATSLAAEIEPLVAEEIDDEKLLRHLWMREAQIPTAEIYVLDEARNLRGSVGFASTPSEYRKVFASTRGQSKPLVRIVPEKMGQVSRAYVGAPLKVEGKEGFLLIQVDARSLIATLGMLSDFKLILLFSGWLILSVIVAVPFAYFITQPILGPFRKVADALNKFAEGDYQVRVSLRGKTEVERHAEAFNTMADAVASELIALERQDRLLRSFLAQISEVLNAPIAEMTEELKKAGSQPRSSAAFREATARLLERCERVNRTLNDLFAIARVQGRAPLEHSRTIDLRQLIEDVLESLNLEIPISSADEYASLPCRGHPGLLGTAVSCLIRHAYGEAIRREAIGFHLTEGEDSVGLALRYPKAMKSEQSGAPMPEAPAPESDAELILSREILALHHRSLEVQRLGGDEVLRFTLPLVRNPETSQIPA